MCIFHVFHASMCLFFWRAIHASKMDACMGVKSLQSCLTLCNTMNNRLPGSSVPGILQARIPVWVAMSFFRNLPDPEIEPAGLMSPALAGWFFTTSATWEALQEGYSHSKIFPESLLHASHTLKCKRNDRKQKYRVVPIIKPGLLHCRQILYRVTRETHNTQ